MILNGDQRTLRNRLNITMTSFAENQLKKYGWVKGQGLGKNAEGIKTPIAIIKKNDTRGVRLEQRVEYFVIQLNICLINSF
jgi:hypothetical protein